MHGKDVHCISVHDDRTLFKRHGFIVFHTIRALSVDEHENVPPNSQEANWRLAVFEEVRHPPHLEPPHHTQRRSTAFCCRSPSPTANVIATSRSLLLATCTSRPFSGTARSNSFNRGWCLLLFTTCCPLNNTPQPA